MTRLTPEWARMITNNAYAATMVRLSDDPAYRALVAAAETEALDTPSNWIARNRLAIHIETHTPLRG